MSSQDERDHESLNDTSTTTVDEFVIDWLLVIGMPFLIGFITWGVIVLAFSGWKLQ